MSHIDGDCAGPANHLRLAIPTGAEFLKARNPNIINGFNRYIAIPESLQYRTINQATRAFE